MDNLETIDDPALLSFLQEGVPEPTKVLVTTRHRLDVAYPIRLVGMPRPDALAMIALEAAARQVDVTAEWADALYARTWGVPLAMVWSIGLLSLGQAPESVIRRLGSGHGDIARFCFQASVESIRERDAYRLLLALGLFDASVSRQMLGAIAGLGEDEIGRDDALSELLRLSLINYDGMRFSLLPLTRAFVRDELAARTDLAEQLQTAWVGYLLRFALDYTAPEWRWHDLPTLRAEGEHLRTLGVWAEQNARQDLFLQILPALILYYDMVGDWAELARVEQDGLNYAVLAGNQVQMIYLYNQNAWLLSQQGQHVEAERMVLTALGLGRVQGAPDLLCDLLQTYSQVLRRAGRFTEAYDCCKEALTLVPQLAVEERPYLRANVEYEIGKIARDQKDWDKADRYFRQAQTVFRSDDATAAFNPERAWGLLGNLGFIAHQRGDLDQAAPLYEQARAFFQQVGGVGYLVTILTRLATLEAERGRKAQALALTQEALAYSRRIGLAQEQTQLEALERGLTSRSENSIPG